MTNTSVRTPEGKVRLFHASTGEAREFWPVDARTIIASGEYAATPPEWATMPTVAPVAPTPVMPPAPAAHPLGIPVVAATAATASPAAPMAPAELSGTRTKAKGAKPPQG